MYDFWNSFNMNILIPDSWLREYLETKATPKQIKEYLSLCGPSVERMHEDMGDVIYDMEITTNRPDAMSVMGVAREAAAILPRFGITAKFLNKSNKTISKGSHTKSLTVKTDTVLNPRWTSIVIENVTVKPSPDWLKKKLEATGTRSLNNIIDITNYLMRLYGQPAHAFDFDAIADKPNHATMTLRASKKGEKLTTLDGRYHTLPGDDIVIEDGKGRLIDLCGVMGAQNSAIKDTTKTIILFLQTYDAMHIRRTMMNLAHRSEAGGLFEKGTDPELVLPAFSKGVELITELSSSKIASKLYDIYPNPYKPYTVSVTRSKGDAYIGKRLTDKEIMEILTPLGFQTKVTKESITVTVPSFRRDITIDVDIIEELARIYGYHNITSTLPDTAPPVTLPDPTLGWEEEIKIRLRDWGFTELYTYSMISEELMDAFHLDKTKAYKITNPLSNEWVYMRPSLRPSMLMTIKQNKNIRDELKLFELSMIYEYRPGNLPNEKPMLLVAWTREHYYEAKGLAEAILKLFGISSAHLTSYGSVSVVEAVTILELDVAKLVTDAKPQKTYSPIPKYPPSYEDLAFVLPPRTPVGPMISALKSAHPLVADVTLLDQYETTTTLHITYLSTEKNLTTEDLRPVREKLIALAQQKFNATLKSHLA